jgi:hypothetical protein
MQQTTKNAIMLLSQSTTATAGIHPSLADIFFYEDRAVASDGVAITTVDLQDLPARGPVNGREFAAWLGSLDEEQVFALRQADRRAGEPIRFEARSSSGTASIELAPGELPDCPARIDTSDLVLAVKFDTQQAGQGRLSSALKSIGSTGVDNTFGWSSGITLLAEADGLLMFATNNVQLASVFVPAEVPEMLVGTSSLLNAAAVKILHRAVMHGPAAELYLDSSAVRLVGQGYTVEAACILGNADPLEFVSRINAFPADGAWELPDALTSVLARHQQVSAGDTTLDFTEGLVTVSTATATGGVLTDSVEFPGAQQTSEPFVAGAGLLYRACGAATRALFTPDAAAFFGSAGDVTLIAARG